MSGSIRRCPRYDKLGKYCFLPKGDGEVDEAGMNKNKSILTWLKKTEDSTDSGSE